MIVFVEGAKLRIFAFSSVFSFGYQNIFSCQAEIITIFATLKQTRYENRQL